MLNPDCHQTRPGSNERLPDVRDIVDYADRIGQLARIDGADWNLEIGVLAEIFAHSNPGPLAGGAVRQDQGLSAGHAHRVGPAQFLPAASRISFGFPDSDDPTTIVKAYRDRMKNDFKLIPPVAVNERADPGERRPRRRRRPVQVSGADDPREGRRPLHRHLLRRHHAGPRHRLGQSRHLSRGRARQAECRRLDFARQARPPDPREIFQAEASPARC